MVVQWGQVDGWEGPHTVLRDLICKCTMIQCESHSSVQSVNLMTNGHCMLSKCRVKTSVLIPPCHGGHCSPPYHG